MKLPDGFKPLKKVEKILQDKVKLYYEEESLIGQRLNCLLMQAFWQSEKMLHERAGCKPWNFQSPACDSIDEIQIESQQAKQCCRQAGAFQNL